MAGGTTARVHPSKRHNHPLQYKSGKPRLRPLNITQLTELVSKTQRKKDKSKIYREIAKKQARSAV
jgi:hypothetical protein